MARIELSAVTLRKGHTLVLDDVSLSVGDGEVLGLIGPSGSGKTALLRLMCGLDRPTEGRVLLDGEPVDTQRPGLNRVAMVFQGDALYEHLDVGGNLRFPLVLRGEPGARAEGTARHRVRGLGLERLWRRRPSTLSGGERGMVAMGRAIAGGRPRALLLDEPLARADRRLRARFRAELRRLHEETGVTVVVASNDQEEAMALADRVAVLMAGRILQVGAPPAIHRRPDTTAVASFVGNPAMNLLPARLERSPEGAWRLRVGDDMLDPVEALPSDPVEAPVVVGLHPSELFEAPPGTRFDRVLHATVAAVEPLGHTTVVRFGLGSAGSTAFAFLGTGDVEAGRRLQLTWQPGRLRLFDPVSGRRIGE